jgi:hypothetical protein
LEQRERHPSTLSQPSGTTKDNVKKTFDWTRQTAELLSRLNEALSGMITFWERFNSLHGDIGYFANIQSSEASKQHVESSLRAINDAFETLQGLQRALNLMSDFCQDYANAVSSIEIIVHLHCALRRNDLLTIPAATSPHS